jgi:hypothetical protein
MGNSYLPLHPQGETRTGSEQTYVLSGRDADHTREVVTTPAVQVNDPAAFDVEVNRPGPGGSWLHLVVTLKPGATVGSLAAATAANLARPG